MKQHSRMALAAAALFSAFSTSAPVFAGPLEPYMVTQLSEIVDSIKETNESVKETNMRLQQVLKRLYQQDQNTQNGTCWLDGKAFSQGAVAMVAGHASACGVQPKTDWPQWRPVSEEGPGITGQYGGPVK